MAASGASGPTGLPSVADVVASDLCIGCGLCEAVTGGRVSMALTGTGSLRPSSIDGFTAAEERAILTACPGVVAIERPDPGPEHAGSPRRSGLVSDGPVGPVEAPMPGPPAVAVDPIWGRHRRMTMAWAGEPRVRFQAATGGVLTALGRHVLATGEAAFVLHTGADPQAPTRNRWVMSETPDEVLANAGSRYNPAAPLAGLVTALDRGEPFAVIAKPCDLGALHAYAAVDRRVDELVVARLALVCGGQSRMTKTLDLLDGLGVAEDEVTMVRYRGHGNPGPTRIETVDGDSHEVTYNDLWIDESTWDLETRCKLCPDALGEAADIAAADAWPGGAPVGEDDGFNAVVIRTRVGERLMAEATAAGRLTVGEPLTAEQLNDFQPHQVRKKLALSSRNDGVADAGVTPIRAEGLRIDELGRRLDPAIADAQRAGARRRMEEIRASGPSRAGSSGAGSSGAGLSPSGSPPVSSPSGSPRESSPPDSPPESFPPDNHQARGTG